MGSVYGLYYTSVGPDTEMTGFFENIPEEIPEDIPEEIPEG